MVDAVPSSDLSEWDRLLAAAGHTPIGEVPARVLLARLVQAKREIEVAALAVVEEARSACGTMHVAIDEALALIDEGCLAEAATRLRQIKHAAHDLPSHRKVQHGRH